MTSTLTPAELVTKAAAVIEQLHAQLQFAAAVDQDVALILRDADQWLDDYEQAKSGGKVPARLNGRCVWCGDPMPVPARDQGGGRTKRFCSAAHRVAHHRWTKDPINNPAPPGGHLNVTPIR